MRSTWKKILTSILMVVMVLTMCLGAGSTAWADTVGSGGAGVLADIGELVVTSYTVTYTDNGNPVNQITKNSKIDITLQLKHTGLKANAVSDFEGNLDISRRVDSFSGGTITSTLKSYGDSPLVFETKVSGLVYSGTGNSLSLMVGYSGDSRFDTITIPISQCREYEEPVYEPYVPEDPDPIPAPMAVISRNELKTPIRAGETRTVTIYVKNVGKAIMKSPLISFSASDCLILPGTSTTLQMKDIYPEKTESVDITVQALDKITSVSQELDMDVKFQYYNLVSTVDGSCSGSVTIPAEVTKEKEPEKEEEENTIDSPVPNLIITSFSYGGGSVAAGEDFNLNFQFVNTSSNLAVENVVVTLEGGDGFTINGATNTFYFEKVKAGGSRNVSLPMKALADVKNGAHPVSVSFKYEYVDNQKRIAAASDVKMTVPVYQPDRFEISHPTLPVMVYTGEETSVTMNYVNKGKSAVSNVEVRLEGNVETYTPVQNIGNLEAGRSGTIAFAVTAWEAPEASFTIYVTYEDANGDEKTREFPVTLSVEEMVYEDPGMYEPMPEPEPEPQINWKLAGAIAAALIIVLFLIIRKKRKAAALKKETEMWDSWDDDMMNGGSMSPASESQAAGGDGQKTDSQEASK